MSALLPMTHAIEGFQELFLKGSTVPGAAWFSLVVISLPSYGLVLVIVRRQYRRMSN